MIKNLFFLNEDEGNNNHLFDDQEYYNAHKIVKNTPSQHFEYTKIFLAQAKHY